MLSQLNDQPFSIPLSLPHCQGTELPVICSNVVFILPQVKSTDIDSQDATKDNMAERDLEEEMEHANGKPSNLPGGFNSRLKMCQIFSSVWLRNVPVAQAR